MIYINKSDTIEATYLIKNKKAYACLFSLTTDDLTDNEVFNKTKLNENELDDLINMLQTVQREIKHGKR